MINYSIIGSKKLPQLMIAHGLFGSGRNWGAISKRLSKDFCVITVDMRNHAGSFWAEEMTYPAMANDLAEVIEDVGAPVIVLGHSMGGKAAMTLALNRPDLVERMIVADIAPVTYGHTQTPFIDAMQSVDLRLIEKRSDVGDALKALVEEPALRAFFAQSIKFDENGARWLLNLEALRANMQDIIGWPEVSGSYQGPTLFIAGADSDYIDTDGRKAIKPLFPNARFAKLKNAGHWLHADQPRAFVETIHAFCTAP